MLSMIVLLVVDREGYPSNEEFISSAMRSLLSKFDSMSLLI
jgi:hypothetical protein